MARQGLFITQKQRTTEGKFQQILETAPSLEARLVYQVEDMVPWTVSDCRRRVIPLFREHMLSVYLKCHM